MDEYSFVNVRTNKPRFRLVYKPHSVQWIAPSGQSSLWAARRRAARCSLPGAVRRRAASHRPETISLLLSLAPDGGCRAICITANAGGLLHRLFTIAPLIPRPSPNGRWIGVRGAVCFCGPIPAGSRLSALSHPGC